MRKNLNNLKSLGARRKELRASMTAAEVALWTLLKNKQLSGRKFRRQFSIGKYIVDFYCHEEKLAIELDGADHFTEAGMKYDFVREDFLKTQNIRVIRVENKKVFENTGQVLNFIKSYFNT